MTYTVYRTESIISYLCGKNQPTALFTGLTAKVSEKGQEQRHRHLLVNVLTWKRRLRSLASFSSRPDRDSIQWICLRNLHVARNCNYDGRALGLSFVLSQDHSAMVAASDIGISARPIPSGDRFGSLAAHSFL
jgi:hypothetical protein